MPLPPPPPCIMKAPFQEAVSGKARAKPMPNSWPSAPRRRLMTPSTRQCAGNGPMPAAPGYGGGTVVPAGTSAALVISTPSILRPARAVQGSADCDWAARGAISTAASRSDSLQCVITSLPSPQTDLSAAWTILICKARRSSRLLDGCLNFLAFVADFCVRRACHLSADAAPVRNQDDAKPAIFDDPRKGSFPSADCQHAGVIVPANGNHSVLAFLILVAVAPIFIEIEFAIGSTINAKLDGPGGILRGVLDLRTHRDDGTRAHEKGIRSRGASASMSWAPLSDLPVQKSYHAGAAGR